MATAVRYRTGIDYREAVELLFEHAATQDLPVRRVAPRDALGRVAAAAMRSDGPLPPFANSAMDGFAVRSAELAPARQGVSVVLPVAGHTAAGPTEPQQAPPRACAWEIMTGAPVPAGFDAVVPVEQVQRLGGDPPRVEIRTALPAGSHIRAPGEDYASGDVVIRAGEVVTAERLMALHATGARTVEVRARPRVAVIATGSELVGDPKRTLRPGEIRDSNRPYLEALLPQLGAEVVAAFTLADDPEHFARCLAAVRSLHPDLIITSGAVSAGVHDFIPAALERGGARVHFHKLLIRPAKPLLFATLPEGTACFGLPGNPMSSAVAVRFLAVPYLRALQRMEMETWPIAVLENETDKPAAMTFFGKGRVTIGDAGPLRATMLPGQESFRIAPFAQANAWIVLPPGPDRLAPGTPVAIAPLIPGQLRV